LSVAKVRPDRRFRREIPSLRANGLQSDGGSA
jgi:hypothetical protein